MLVYKKTWLSIGWFMVGLVFYLSLIPSPPEINIGFKHIDKVEHFLAYLILMGWFSQIYKANKHRAYFFMFFVVMGVSIEILQGLGKVRFFEYSDMLANSLGVFFAWFITKRQLNNMLFKLEMLLLKNKS